MELFVTVGRGLEKFAANYLLEIGGCHTKILDGKIQFTFKEDLGVLLECKFVERIFAKMLVEHFSEKPAKLCVLTKLHQLAIDSEKLTLAYDVWSIVSGLHRIIVPSNSEQSEPQDCEPAIKQPKLDNKEILYRISCKCTGRMRKKIDAQRLCRDLSSKISQTMEDKKWKSELRNPDFEISIHIAENLLTVGVPLTKIPVSKRAYMKHFGLRSTICDVMVHLAGLQDGDIILDPMCGSGTLIIEAMACHRKIFCIGMELRLSALEKARENLDHFVKSHHWAKADFLNADTAGSVTCLSNLMVDCVICDLPFGQKHGNQDSIAPLYRKCLRIISSILKPTGRTVLLTNDINQKLLLNCAVEFGLQLANIHLVSLGETNGVICVFLRKRFNYVTQSFIISS